LSWKKEQSLNSIISIFFNIEQLGVLQEYIEKNLKKGYIKSLQLSIGYPILFILKKDSSLQLCIDYRQFNAITKKNYHLLPLIVKFKDKLFGAL
jgi:hypothetical protein